MEQGLQAGMAGAGLGCEGEAGITSFEEEFLAHIMLPDGTTVGEHTLPQVERAYLCGKMPTLLPGLAESVVEAEVVDDD